MVEKRLQDWAEKRDYRVATAGIDVLRKVRRKLEARKKRGEIDGEFFRENLSGLAYPDSSGPKGPGALVLVAAPRPVHTVTFTADGRRVEVVIPPTYVRYKKTFEDILDDMKKSVLGPDARAEILKAPLKSLAVHVGLSAYGRNNITYVPEFGSGFQLCGYTVEWDGPVPGSGRKEQESVMERCSSCRACVKACPTGAITEDRFLIRAERCFTLHSESSRPIPDWITPPSRMSLIGCMACQQICPLNKGRLKHEPAGVEFDAEETETFIRAGRTGKWQGPGNGAAASAQAKLDRLHMTEDAIVFGRNLAVLLRQGAGA